MFRPSPPDARRPPELLRVAPRRTRPRGRCARLENERLLHVHADDATPPPAMADPDFVRGLAASPPRSRGEWRRCLGPVSEVTAELVEAVAAVDVRSLACWTPAQTNLMTRGGAAAAAAWSSARSTRRPPALPRRRLRHNPRVHKVAHAGMRTAPRTAAHAVLW